MLFAYRTDPSQPSVISGQVITAVFHISTKFLPLYFEKKSLMEEKKSLMEEKKSRMDRAFN